MAYFVNKITHIFSLSLLPLFLLLSSTGSSNSYTLAFCLSLPITYGVTFLLIEYTFHDT